MQADRIAASDTPEHITNMILAVADAAAEVERLLIEAEPTWPDNWTEALDRAERLTARVAADLGALRVAHGEYSGVH